MMKKSEIEYVWKKILKNYKKKTNRKQINHLNLHNSILLFQTCKMTSSSSSSNVALTTSLSLEKVKGLYYSPTSCGAASFIAAHWAQLNIPCFAVNLNTHQLVSSAKLAEEDFFKINPKGNVPTIVLEDGTILNEGVACLSWIADQSLLNHKNPIQPSTESEKYKILNLLAWVASELQPCISRLIPKVVQKEWPAAVRDLLIERAHKQMDRCVLLLSEGKKDSTFLNGTANLTTVDLIAHIVLGWAKAMDFLKMEEKYPMLIQYIERVKNHPVVVAAVKHMQTQPVKTN
jgi:glutathione S-transferase